MQIANAAAVAKEITESPTYVADFGARAPAAAQVAFVVTNAAKWRDTWAAAKKFFVYASEQRAAWENEALVQANTLKPAFEYAASRDTTVSEKYAATSKFLGATNAIATRAATSRKASTQKGRGEQGGHGGDEDCGRPRSLRLPPLPATPEMPVAPAMCAGEAPRPAGRAPAGRAAGKEKWKEGDAAQEATDRQRLFPARALVTLRVVQKRARRRCSSDVARVARRVRLAGAGSFSSARARRGVAAASAKTAAAIAPSEDAGVPDTGLLRRRPDPSRGRRSSSSAARTRRETSATRGSGALANRTRNDIPGPPARQGHTMASWRGTALLFGGYGTVVIENSTYPFLYDDTWQFDGTAWQLQLATIRAPRPGQAAGVERDGRRGAFPGAVPGTTACTCERLGRRLVDAERTNPRSARLP